MLCLYIGCKSQASEDWQTRLHYPPLSVKMRKRRAFADKELESVMLERELRQKEMEELHRIVMLQASVSPGPSRCFCPVTDAGMPGFMPVLKSNPLVFECDLHCHAQKFKSRAVENCPKEILTTQNFSPSLKPWDAYSGTGSCLEPVPPLSFQSTPQYCHKDRNKTEAQNVPADSSRSTPLSAAADRLDIMSKQDSAFLVPRANVLSQTERPEKHCRATGLESLTHKDWAAKPNSIKSRRPLPFSVEALLKR